MKMWKTGKKCDIIILIKFIYMKNNVAFIDGQNLYMGTTKNEKDKWNINLFKFRKFLLEKYNVKEAYYYLGYIIEKKEIEKLYEELQKTGFIVKFKKHAEFMKSKKKGNVDSEIIFNIMQKLLNKEINGKIILISGDGDYKNLVDYLIDINKFEKIMFPNNNASSLYKELGNKYFIYLNRKDIKDRIS